MSGNIYDALLDEGKGKQPPKKKEVAPKQEAKKAVAAPAAAAAAPAGAKNNNRGGRGRGGRGRGEGRGRGGRGPRPAGNNDVAVAEGHEARPHRGRDHARRGRDQAAKRGDYGAPEGNGRVHKRPYDKFSHSAGARAGAGKDKKGGAGPRNWGDKNQAANDEQAAANLAHQEEEEKVVDEPVVDHVEDEGEKAEEEVEEPEVGYAEFLERKKKEEEELAKLVDPTKTRKVDDSEFKGMKVLSKSIEDPFPAVVQKKKGKKESAPKENGKVNAADLLDIQAPVREREDRRDNRGRGRGRGRDQHQGQRRKGNNVNLSLNNDNDFPSLGGK